MKSVFEVLPTEVMFEIFTSLSPEDVTTMVTSCSAAANTFMTDKRWFYDWADRYYGYHLALMLAVKRRDLDELRRLLARKPKGFDVNSEAEELEMDMTLLRLAARVGHMPSLNELLYGGWGVDVNRPTALHVAVENDQVLSVTTLLNHPDIDPNVRDAEGRTALHLACADDNAVLAALIAQHPKTDVNALNGSGETPLQVAVLSEAGAELLELLVRHPRVDVNARGEHGFTALHISANAACFEDLCVFVMEPRFDLDIRDPNGRTALHTLGMIDRSGKETDVFMCAQLLAVNTTVDNNAQDPDGFTPLHFFAMTNNVEVVEAMASMPWVNVNTVNRWGETAREFALKCGAKEAYDVLGSVVA